MDSRSVDARGEGLGLDVTVKWQHEGESLGNGTVLHADCGDGYMNLHI